MERIGEAEYAVMEVLWSEAPLTAAEVAARVPGRARLEIRTVKTMLARLLAKGVLAHEEEGRRYLYRPAIARADYVAQRIGPADRPHVRRPGDAARRPARRARPAEPGRHRRDRGLAQGAQAMTVWLLANLAWASLDDAGRARGAPAVRAPRSAPARLMRCGCCRRCAWSCRRCPAARRAGPAARRRHWSSGWSSGRAAAASRRTAGRGCPCCSRSGPLGAAAFLAWQWLAYRRFLTELSLDSRSIGAHRGLPLIESAAVQGPVALGLLDRRIVVPADFETPLCRRGARARARP